MEVYSQRRKRGKENILAADRPPEDIMPELKGRDQIVCRLVKPDELGRRDILYSMRHFRGADAEITDFAIDFLAKNFRTNIRELEAYLMRLVTTKRKLNQEITAEDLEKLLQEHKSNSWMRSDND